MMIAVMADIHSNHIALKKCIAEALGKGATEFIFLGDYIGELAYPQRTLTVLAELKRKYPCTFIRGNKEDYWIDHKNGKHKDWHWERGKSGSGMLRYAYDQLTEEQIGAFESMPIYKVMQYKGMSPFVVCHGSPFKVNQSMREDYGYIDDLTMELETELTICGHFHIQTEYIRNGRRVINPGSVGMPLNSVGKTQFMLLYDHDGRWEKEFVALDYDVESVISEMEEERLVEQAPAWCRVTEAVLRGCNISQMTVLTKAMSLLEQNVGKADWRYIPEKYWNMALGYYGL